MFREDMRQLQMFQKVESGDEVDSYFERKITPLEVKHLQIRPQFSKFSLVLESAGFLYI